MKKFVRDLLYVNACPQTNELVNYGMDMEDFFACVPELPQGILLLEQEVFDFHYSPKTRLQFVEKGELEEFWGDDLYSYGTLGWVDYDDRSRIDQLTPDEIARLLYLRHMFQPIGSPFLDKLQNRYAYIAHDDGWFGKIYFKHIEDATEIIANKIVRTMKHFTKRVMQPLPCDIKAKLMSLSCGGLLVDFRNITRAPREISVPIHRIGKRLDMDDVRNNLSDYLANADYSANLVKRNRRWTIE